MVEITAQDVQEAFKRFEDFGRVQGGAEGMGEDEMRDALRALLEGRAEGAHPDAIAAFALSVGITEEARREFYVRAEEQTNDPILPADQVVDFAAFMGLVVGLSARQIAEDREQD
jgi:hypothetical protein